MKTLKTFCFVTLFFFGAAHADKTVSARWSCFDYLDSNKQPIVTAWIYSDGLGGKIQANGISKIAEYSQQGLEHRWDFDLDDGRYNAAFVIEANGTGKYFYFGSNKSAKPSLVTKCEKTK